MPSDCPSVPNDEAAAGIIDAVGPLAWNKPGAAPLLDGVAPLPAAPASETWLVDALFAPGSTMRTVLAGEVNAAGAALVRLPLPASTVLAVETPLVGAVRLVPCEAKILSTSSAAGGFAFGTVGELACAKVGVPRIGTARACG